MIEQCALEIAEILKEFSGVFEVPVSHPPALQLVDFLIEEFWEN